MRWAFWTLAAAYVVVFLGWFHSARLFGTGTTEEGRLRRYFLLGTALTPSNESALVDLGKRLSDPQHLHQRVPLLAASAGIWIVALLAGDSLLRVIFGRRRFGGWTRFVFAFGLGMGLISLVVLALGLAGALTHRSALAVGIVAAAIWVFLWLFVRAPKSVVDPAAADSFGWKTKTFLFVVMTPFAAMSLLSACLPTTDYDALGYHLLAPREWFEAGRIFFLPHNVYASFPFLTEMYHLLGMAVARDWFAGGLIGQITLWAFAPMGALAVGLLAARWFGVASGWMAAFIYFTAPWVFRLSAIPYVEGAMLFFGTLAVQALAHRQWFLVGAFVGCAAACKYTALVMLGVPLGVAAAWPSVAFRSAKVRAFAERKATVLAFAIGVMLFFGPWLVRNAAWTGNPVYPLAYSIFGGENWSPEKAAKFAAGHRSTDFGVGSVFRYVTEIPVHSDWQSGLAFALAPIPFAVCLFLRRSASEQCFAVWALSAMIAWQFIAFFLFTHRLDRFWLPLLPYACVLAGAGWSAFPAAMRLWIVAPLAAVATLYNFVYCITPHTALNDRAADLLWHREFSKGAGSKAVLLADQSGKVARNATVLFVGYGGVYYSSHPFRYNSVFDDPIIELLAADPSSPNGVAPTAEVRRRFRERGIDYVVVDWEWIRKYRSPGNYGYSEFVTPKLFDDLQSMGVLLRTYSEALDAPSETKSTEPKPEIYRVDEVGR